VSWRQADLVVVRAGIVGGWASYGAKVSGAERGLVIERGVVGLGASSRAAGIVRAQGGTAWGVRMDLWSIDFYDRQQSPAGNRLRIPPGRLHHPRNHKAELAGAFRAGPKSTSCP
jgi:glycine/D-amino acid oxidase-like deaminating enzyme